MQQGNRWTKILLVEAILQVEMYQVFTDCKQFKRHHMGD